MSDMPASLDGRQIAMLLQQALAHLMRNEFGPAETALKRALMIDANNADVLHLFGQMRRVQGRFEDAENYYRKALAIAPARAEAHHHLGQLMQAKGLYDDAIASYREALRLKPDFVQARVDLAIVLTAKQDYASAESELRDVLRSQPDFPPAIQALSAALIFQSRYGEAEALTRAALARGGRGPRQIAALKHDLGVALSGQNRHADALHVLSDAQALAPDLPHLDFSRGNALQSLGKLEDAESAYRRALMRDPFDLKAHRGLTLLLYRMNRSDYLSAYDDVLRKHPIASPLLTEKGKFLLLGERYEEAAETFSRALKLAPEDVVARDGLASVLTRQGRFDEAIAEYRRLLAQAPSQIEMRCNYAECLLRAGDAEQGVRAAEDAIALAPHHQLALALWGVGLRQSGDGREEELNDYENFVQIFDLPPPEGFPDMESFNRALNEYLTGLHVDAREHLNQTSRNGTKTSQDLFGAGHDLVELLRSRIDEAVGEYIARLKESQTHPLLSRRAGGFAYGGSWSTRLSDCGFHTNHVHPLGWLSSAYYVALPEMAANGEERQGWIKFGEPSFEAKLKPRRAVQPVPGRLVLFPSYMWHGTIPFRSRETRTTIAFDVLPKKA